MKFTAAVQQLGKLTRGSLPGGKRWGRRAPLMAPGLTTIVIFQDLRPHSRLIMGRSDEPPKITSQGGPTERAG